MFQAAPEKFSANPEKFDDLVALFAERAGVLGVEVERVADSQAAVAALLEIAANLETTRAVSSTELLGRAPTLASALGRSDLMVTPAESPETSRDEELGVTTALHAVAETGSLLTSEATLADRSVAMLTMCCAFVVSTFDIVPGLDDTCSVLRSLALGPNGAYTTFVTGPSRTADIEMSLTVGVQGPRRIVVLFVDSLT